MLLFLEDFKYGFVTYTLNTNYIIMIFFFLGIVHLFFQQKR